MIQEQFLDHFWRVKSKSSVKTDECGIFMQYDFYTIFYPNDLYLFSFNKRFRAIRTKRRKTTTTTKYEMFRGFLNCLKGTPGFISNFQSKIWIKMIDQKQYTIASLWRYIP